MPDQAGRSYLGSGSDASLCRPPTFRRTAIQATRNCAGIITRLPLFDEVQPLMPFGDAFIRIGVEGLVALLDARLDPGRLAAKHQMGPLGRDRQAGIDDGSMRMHQFRPSRVP